MVADMRTQKAQATRQAILAAAEEQFARLGYADTRLEDIGLEVGIGRSAVLYHFQSKEQLYDAVIRTAIGDMMNDLRRAVVGSRPLAERFEEMISVALDHIARRPSFAQIALRLVGTSDPERKERLLSDAAPIIDLLQAMYDEGIRTGEIRPPLGSDFFHILSVLSGGTMFYVAALPAITKRLPYDLLSPDQFDTHKREVLLIARVLLGIGTVERSMDGGVATESSA